jgi:hypothetical protein
MPEYQSCNCAVEHTVAKKLQALIVREAMAAVGQRLAQQRWLVEDIANFLAKCSAVHILIIDRDSRSPKFQTTLFANSSANSFAN